MSIEERLADLDKRLAKLEKIEKRRKSMAIIKACCYLIVVIAFAIFAYKAYGVFMEYKEKLDYFSGVGKTLDTGEDYLNYFKDFFK